MQILNETAMPNPNPNLSPNHDTHTDACLDNHYHANNDWGDDHNYDTLNAESQALCEYYAESCEYECWHNDCRSNHQHQDNCYTNSNTIAQQAITMTPTPKMPTLTTDAQGNILGIRYVYADWLNDDQRALVRCYVQHMLAPTKPVIEHIRDLCHENKVSFDELASLSLGIRAYQNDIRCQCCGMAQMIYPKVAKFKMAGFRDLGFEKALYYVCAECNLFREVPF